jgi:signal transduction histidine kinase
MIAGPAQRGGLGARLWQPLRFWAQSSLANAFALAAALMALTCSAVVALLFSLVMYRVESASMQRQLEVKAERAVERLDNMMAVVQDTLGALSRNATFMTALLDSRGRETYVVPFLSHFSFPVAAPSGLVLCDINGVRLAASPGAQPDCRARSAAFQAVLNDGISRSEWAELGKGERVWVVYQGVRFAYTGTVEGVMVAHLHISEAIEPFASEFLLEGVAIRQPSSEQWLASVGRVVPSQAHDVRVSRPMGSRLAREGAAAPMLHSAAELVLMERQSPFDGKRWPFAWAFFLGSLLLLLSLAWWARRAATRIVAPLQSLIDAAQRLAHDRDLPVHWPRSHAGEVGTLARAFATMAMAVRHAERALEDKVEQRTAALHRSEEALRSRSAQLDAVFALSPDGFVVFDTKGRVTLVNPAFTQLLSLEAETVVGCDEAGFDRLLLDRSADHAPFMGLSDLRAVASLPKGGPGEPSAQVVAVKRFELRSPASRVLDVGLRLSRAENISAIFYVRDVTFESEVDRLKSEFLTTAAHELRTPMASVCGYTELLLMRNYSEERRRDMLGTIKRQADRIVTIIAELLDLARIESRRGKDFDMKRLPLRDVVAEVVRDLAPPEGREPPQLSLPDTEGPTWVWADAEKLAQALLNVLSNAYRYSEAPSGVAVKLTWRDAVAGPEVGVAVQDGGVGMSPEQVQRVCERFYRADPSCTIPGTGLGMSIVKEIMDIHHGHIEFETELGQGCTVTLWFPLKAATAS